MWRDLFGSGGASDFAREIDLLTLCLFGLSVFFTLGVFATVFWFSILYRQREGHTASTSRVSRAAVALWTMAPLAVVLAVYFWGSRIEAKYEEAPSESIEIEGSARQWMWKFQHADGPAEINSLHLPVDVPVRLSIQSEDVMHRLALPAFGVQIAALPHTISERWIRPTREGMFRFYCTEFCGSGYSTMSGTVYVLDPITYEHWVTGDTASMTPEQAGELLFAAFRCDSCHLPEGNGTGPALVGRFGKDTKLKNGSSTSFNAAYVRTSLLEPKLELVDGYEPVMPSYKTQLNETQISQLNAFLESIGDN